MIEWNECIYENENKDENINDDEQNSCKDDIEQYAILDSEELSEIAGVKNKTTHTTIVNEAEEHTGEHENINYN